MTAHALDVLAAVRACGGDVKVIGPDRLRVVAPVPLLPHLVERVRAVKPELLTVLAEGQARAGHASAAEPAAPGTSWTPDDWRAYYSKRVEIRQRLDARPRAAAERLAWGELQNEWHMRHGESTPPRQCAGCGEPIGGREALALADGCSVHRDDDLQCLIAYGRRWRAAATRALTAMGLAAPRGEGMP